MRKFKQLCYLLVFVPVLFLVAGCGGTSDSGVASSHFGPVGPTDPSGLFFDTTVTPTFVQAGNTTGVTVRVWDEFGNRVGGVIVQLIGGEEGVAGITDTNGFLHTFVEIDDDSFGISWFTVTIETASITFPVQIIGETTTTTTQ